MAGVRTRARRLGAALAAAAVLSASAAAPAAAVRDCPGAQPARDSAGERLVEVSDAG